uniref:Uncharacterized protein n=1 Tax=Rhizophora mucronata TaxID=61149 RepID=A0A2P2QWY9_RHIMU
MFPTKPTVKKFQNLGMVESHWPLLLLVDTLVFLGSPKGVDHVNQAILLFLVPCS